jgi:release factor glutamine methyltransferase
MTERFEGKGLDAPRIVAEMLLAHVLGCERMRLYMEVDRPASPDELAALRELVRRATEHEPVQYLVGAASFFGRELLVDRSTMIPQPCTEDLITAVLDGLEAVEGPVRIADLGTGSGCVAIALALQVPTAQVVATDVVPEALALAARNAERHGVDDRIELVEGPGLEPLRERAGDAPFDVICGNLPYVPDDEWSDGRVQTGVRRFVPESALRGGPEGLDVIGPVIAGAGGLLAPGGRLCLEIAHAQHDAVIDLVNAAADLEAPRVRRDYEGLWRVLVADRRRG